MLRRRRSKNLFNNIISIICVLLALAILYSLFFDKGKDKNPNTQATTKPTQTQVTTAPTQLVNSEELLGKWKESSGMFLEFTSSKVKIGILGNESEANTYSYTLLNDKLTVLFKEGDSLKDSTWLVEGSKLTIDYGTGKHTFVKSN